MTDLESCRLCEWRYGADRLRGERGVCLSLPSCPGRRETGMLKVMEGISDR
ncbi:hypothetical protein [Methanoculleus frigidifontis]|uniref:hypothetical protein n=1 Tax=Methanoculleus frigidifontis TaxID=2584085 RepID=UPI00265B6DE7|nr:hypothetical protein [Methanoculleus sp. FWC-SCC1]